MVQLPAAVRCTGSPSVSAVHWPLAVKVTALPDAPPVALTAKSGSPKVLLARAPKVIVWPSLWSVTVNGALAAEALKLSSAARVAASVQEPLASLTDTVLPATEQPLEPAELKL